MPSMKKLLKRIVKVQEIEGEGLEGLMGERVTLFCQIYIYTGDLVGVNDDYVLLENPSIVYETGSFTDKAWKDEQPLPNQFYVMKNAIESFGILK